MENTSEYVSYEEKDLISKPLWYHCLGLQQTASGYGRKLTTSKMLQVGKKLYRVYCICYSNSGSCYIIKNKKRLFLKNW